MLKKENCPKQESSRSTTWHTSNMITYHYNIQSFVIVC